MNVFLSYPSARRDFAERLKLGLEAEGHEVFFDRDDLLAGEAFHEAIRQAVAKADLFIFVVTPESLRLESYARAELALAQSKWPRPAGHVLPVVLAPVDMAQMPPYLMAVTLLEPKGDAVATTLAAVARLNRSPARRWAVRSAIGVLALAALAATWAVQQRRQHAAAELVQRVGEAVTMAKLCFEGNPAEPFAQLSALAEQPDAPKAVQQAHQDCAMHWLRLGRPGLDRTFAQFTAPLRPVLVKALATGAQAVNGPRAADLRAHLGWADALLWQDQRDPGIDPSGLYREALQQDPGNAYAHAMWGSWLLWRPSTPSQVQEALKHYEAALASGRDRAFTRQLQIGALMGHDELGLHLMQALNQMRLRGEPLAESVRGRIWSRHFSFAWRAGALQALTGAMSPQEALDTYNWLFPPPHTSESRYATWAWVRATLLERAGQIEEARSSLQPVLAQMKKARSSGPVVDAVTAFLARKP